MNTPARPRVLSGIQSTAGSFHFGNYLGALRYWVRLQDTHDAFYFIANMHAITVDYDPAQLPRRTKVAAAQLLALGLDPELCTLFVQSHVPEHAELAWVLGCLTGFGEAERMTQFKEKSERGTASVGLFTYPVLQAADILLYQADQVPVGEDQRQHLELTRTLARRFNTRYGETFTVPESHIVRETAKITDLQEPTAKMSKSSSSVQGIVDLLEDPKVLRRKIMRAVTDPGTEIRAGEDKPGVTNLLTIFSALTGSSVAELERRYAGSGYGALKKDLAEAATDFVVPVQERVHKLLAQETGSSVLERILAEGAARAGGVARETMAAVRDRVGFVPPIRTVP
ncbi:MAG: tryptophan--tRNA ligase [Streptosporangiaceae bacterium]